MSFHDLMETAQAQALADKLYPDERAVWKKACRDYSKLFSTPLHLVLEMSTEHVLTELYSDRLSEWDEIEQLDDIFDLIHTLEDRDYNTKLEKIRREQDKKLIESEKKRREEGRAVHSSLEKSKLKFVKEESSIPKELPKSGGINMDLIRKLNNSENEG